MRKQKSDDCVSKQRGKDWHLAADAAYCDGVGDVIALLQRRHGPADSGVASLLPEIAVHCRSVTVKLYGGMNEAA